MFALGIDPGLTRCGYGAVSQTAGRLKAVSFGHLATPPEMAVEARLAMLWDDLQELLDELQPEVVVVERVLFQVNVRTAMAVGQASGLVLASAARRRIPVVQYSPNEVKKAVAGSGNADKGQIQRMVKMLLSLQSIPDPPDQADALALAICHLSGAGLRSAVAGAGAVGSPVGSSASVAAGSGPAAGGFRSTAGGSTKPRRVQAVRR